MTNGPLSFCPNRADVFPDALYQRAQEAAGVAA
jgi:hypothetical protein